MENPVSEVEGVIRQLTQTRPSVQRQTVEKYFTPDAAFTHPFCRTGSFDGSRFLIVSIYRWYKIMSPRIDLAVHSVAYDEQNQILYVNISQVFWIWFVPIIRASVNLTTVLALKYDKFGQKYYIKSQNDLYQTDQFVRFFLPGGFLLVWLWQFFATIVCMINSMLFWPVTWFEEEHSSQIQEAPPTKDREEHVSIRNVPLLEQSKGSGRMVTAPAVQQR